MTGSSKGSGDRGFHVKVKTSRGRRASSTQWLQRQLNDPYVRRAKADGYRSRAAYKLLEIDDKHKLLKPGYRVVDLGAAPGGWCQVAAARVKSAEDAPKVVGIDYLEMDHLPGVTFLQKDFLDDDAPAALLEALGGYGPDVILSDMASPTTGHRQTDHLRTTHLFEVAIHFAELNLVPGGSFLAKVFRGGTENELLQQLKRSFKTVSHLKPPASRKESPELYVIAKGFRGRPENLSGHGDDTDA
ncbi:RlmE family RNA methyltransferase [Roseibium sp. CAU 1637]|uniref:Ribosomal RNA large subunit methyltransferase E n=1 Tax=Roseibium limicola TaxID=2816037 RepID=A0A939EL15_9HYPH|nr:RlmE family RNA methyltransferase [Roseibium limicola]MBO0344397.1 RlmE family RNA methyltransferase [Roseibium limicola]